MSKTFLDALKHRRSVYGIENSSPASDGELKKILEQVLLHTPSAFNTQTSRLVLLLGAQHAQLWEIVRETLRARVAPEKFAATDQKIDSFAAGYGSVLFFEDVSALSALNVSASYTKQFPKWSAHTSGMHQLAVWTALEDAGLGASLQHYNPIIDDEVKRTWDVPSSWSLVAQMPFGAPTALPGDKDFLPLEQRLFIHQ